jgi:basic membrane lipoprotein Med (substrate-binding protein (PBP1-ABC) superfamily)
VAYVGNWDDVSAGKEQALAQIAQGADIIFQNADAAGRGFFRRRARRNGHSYSGRTLTRIRSLPTSSSGAS